MPAPGRSIWAPVVNSALGVWAMGSDATRMYLGGDFTRAGGVDQQHIAMWVDPSAGVGAHRTDPGSDRWRRRRAPGVAAALERRWIPIQRYKIRRKPAGSGSYPNAALATVSTGTVFDDTTVANGTAYTYKVVAINGVGAGPASNDVTVTPSSLVQTPPALRSRSRQRWAGRT